MDSNSRIKSIVESAVLDSSITGLQTFDLSTLKYDQDSKPKLPSNVRLGHLAEEVVKHCVDASDNYNLLYHNVQLIDEKRTIGELDFILQEKSTKAILHMEMAYKFYLYDPSLSEHIIGNWIGPNRNDSLSKKLKKLKEKQFPLLFHPRLKSMLPDLDVHKVSQALCMLASLYVPLDISETFDPSYQKAIKGHYMDFESFKLQNHQNKQYCTPERKKWGMYPEENADWGSFEEVVNYITLSVSERQSVLLWSREGDSFSEFFVTWW